MAPTATQTQKAPVQQVEPTDTSGKGLGWKTILFNCNCHSFDDVERQLMKAIRCGLALARNIAWEVHSKGKAVIYSGPRERCEAVAMVLEDIGLKVKVAQ